MLTFFLFCLLAGCAAGFLAGLFGIGGGMVIVPMMVYLLPIVGVPDSLLMSTALGTSFATIVITAFSSAQRHHKLGNVVWSTLKYFAPALMISAFISGQYISKLPPEISGKLFACLVVYLAVKMILSIKPKNVEPNKKITPLSSIIGGSLIGMISSVAGIGGGGFIVPFLNSRNVDIKKAIGTSAFCGMLMGIAGMLSFMVSGWGTPGMPNYSIGFVYLPAVLGITITSFFTSKLGANMTNRLPVSTLKKGFATFLIVVAINMLLK